MSTGKSKEKQKSVAPRCVFPSRSTSSNGAVIRMKLIGYVGIVIIAILTRSVAGDAAHSDTNLSDEKTLPFWAQILLAVFLVGLSAIFAGLTIGIMGLDTLSLEIIADSGSEPDRSYAQQLLPVRKMGHQALSTLVLGNMWANVMIAQFCADIDPEGGSEGSSSSGTGALVGFLLSTVIILIFTEILPMSICKSENALKIAARGVPILRVFIFLLYPIAKPLGMLLDKIIEHDIGQIYDRNELKRLMVLHCQKHGDVSGLEQTELNLMLGAMEFHERVVGEVMTPIEKATVLYEDDVLDMQVVRALWMDGHSRVPVCRSRTDQIRHILGIIYVKDLLCADIQSGTLTVADVMKESHRELNTVGESLTLPKMLQVFQRGTAHMVVVQKSSRSALLRESEKAGTSVVNVSGNSPDADLQGNPDGEDVVESVGLVTLEDIIEEILKSEIYDEYDVDLEDEDEHEVVMLGDELTSDQGGIISGNEREGGGGTPAGRLSVPRAPRRPVRVHICSYLLEAHPSPRMTDDQAWALSYFLVDAVDAFAHWKVNYVRLLLQVVGELHVHPSLKAIASLDKLSSGTPSSTILAAPSSTETPQYHRPFTTPPTPCLPPIPSHAVTTPSTAAKGQQFHTMKEKALSEYHLFESSVEQQEHLLYRKGHESSVCTLVLSGGVEMLIGEEPFRNEVRSFSRIGEGVLMGTVAGTATAAGILCASTGKYIPDFSARVCRPSRLVRITKELYDKVFALQEGRSTRLISRKEHHESHEHHGHHHKSAASRRPASAVVPQHVGFPGSGGAGTTSDKHYLLPISKSATGLSSNLDATSGTEMSPVSYSEDGESSQSPRGSPRRSRQRKPGEAMLAEDERAMMSQEDIPLELGSPS